MQGEQARFDATGLQCAHCGNLDISVCMCIVQHLLKLSLHVSGHVTSVWSCQTDSSFTDQAAHTANMSARLVSDCLKTSPNAEKLTNAQHVLAI